jgi:hypothetical protein
MRPLIGRASSGELPHVTTGCEASDVDAHLTIESSAGIGAQRRPIGEGTIKHLAGRRQRAADDVVERRLVGGDHANAGTGFDAHVAERHALRH